MPYSTPLPAARSVVVVARVVVFYTITAPCAGYAESREKAVERQSIPAQGFLKNRPEGYKQTIMETFKSWVGKRVRVIFNYDVTKPFYGTIIEDPPQGNTVIELDDGRIVKGSQCQYTLA